MSLSLLRLQSLGPKELLEDFDVLSKWIDCASWYSPPVNWLPPPILSPVINTMRAQRYQILDHMLGKATDFFCGFPPRPIWAGALWCVKLYVSKRRRAGFCYLTAPQHPLGEPLCQMRLQGMVFVRAWAKTTTSNPLLSLHFFPLESEPESCAYKLATSLTWSKQDLKLIEEYWCTAKEVQMGWYV